MQKKHQPPSLLLPPVKAEEGWTRRYAWSVHTLTLLHVVGIVREDSSRLYIVIGACSNRAHIALPSRGMGAMWWTTIISSS